MVQELDSEGICGTCDDRTECLSHQRGMKEEKPALHCDAFNDSGPKTAREERKEAPGAKCTQGEGGRTVKRSYARGVCIHCDDNSICKYPGFGQDIIFCEEYRLGGLNNRVGRCPRNTFVNLPVFGVKNLIPGGGS